MVPGIRKLPTTAAAAWLSLLAPLTTAAAQQAKTPLAAQALAALDSPAATAGPLALLAALELADGAASRPDLLPATLTVELPEIGESGPRPASWVEIAVVVAAFESAPQTLTWSGDVGDGAAVLRLLLEVAEEVDRVIVAAARGDVWGTVEAEFGAAALSVRPAIEVDLRPVAAAALPPPVLRLLPPTRRPVTGEERIRVLLSDVPVASVRFELDGREVAADDDPPFAAVIDFGASGDTRVVQALAYDASGRELGSDRITVNEVALQSRVRIRELRAGDRELEVAAELELPAGLEPERLDFYLNGERLGELAAPPWRVRLPRPRPQPTDFVRVVAHLGDGSVLEDARLVEASGERVEVNLVQVFAVVTGRDGSPRRDLTRNDFSLRLGGRELPIDRFAPAHEVPLVLGLVIDTSGSMYALMPDTRQAGAHFVAETLRRGDRAFLVDFDTRPRLAAGLTGDVGALLRRFTGLEAEGFTALYDAVIFSMLQFESEPGRKALVVLTDGDDYKSRFSSRRCIQYGRELGVPVYVIALGSLFGVRRDVRKLDLESLTRSTGGRVFYITAREQLGEAYAQIAEELRSQYLLAFTQPRPLSAEELGAIRVHVRGRGLRVRAVTPSRRP